MWAEERRQRIITMLADEARVTAAALAIEFDVSRETIRRDFMELEADGLIKRTHGGALVSQSTREQPFHERLSARTVEKQAIAVAAAHLIQPGESCFIDAGSTTASFVQSLATVENVSVITNSVIVAMTLREMRPEAEIILLGGALGRDVPGTYGALAIEQLALLRADVAFISPVGIDAETGVSYFDLAEADVARAMIRNARRKVVLADASKWGVVSRVVVCPCRDVDVLVSDIGDPAPFRAAGIAKVITTEKAQSGKTQSAKSQSGQGKSKPRKLS